MGHAPIAKLEGRSIYALHSDHLGTPRAATDRKGNEVWSADYSPFGRAHVSDSSTITLNLRFPGQYEDAESGYHYNYLRDYDPDTGRYLTSDPIGLEGGYNLYEYVGGNPISFFDPLGLVKWVGTGVGYSVIFGGGMVFDAYHLTSECVDGVRYVVQIHASGSAVGFGLQASGSGGFYEFEDNRAKPSPDAFVGQFKKTWAGGVFGVGLGMSAIQLGEAVAFPAGVSAGVDASAGGTVGWSWVHFAFKDSCTCQNQ